MSDLNRPGAGECRGQGDDVALDGDAVVFATAPGYKLNGVSRSTGAFEVDCVDAATRSGWSVVVHALAQEITDADAPSGRHRLAARPCRRGRAATSTSWSASPPCRSPGGGSARPPPSGHPRPAIQARGSASGGGFLGLFFWVGCDFRPAQRHVPMRTAVIGGRDGPGPVGSRGGFGRPDRASSSGLAAIGCSAALVVVSDAAGRLRQFLVAPRAAH